MKAIADWVRYQNITLAGWFAIVGFVVIAGLVWFVIIVGGMRIENERSACRARGLVPVTYGGHTECATGSAVGSSEP